VLYKKPWSVVEPDYFWAAPTVGSTFPGRPSHRLSEPRASPGTAPSAPCLGSTLNPVQETLRSHGRDLRPYDRDLPLRNGDDQDL